MGFGQAQKPADFLLSDAGESMAVDDSMHGMGGTPSMLLTEVSWPL